MTKWNCNECGAPVSRKETIKCKSCYDKSRPVRIDPAIKKEKRRLYKAQYYQKNKTRIEQRNLEYRRNNSEKIRQQRMKYHLRHKRGIEMDDYNKLLVQQNKKCAICDYAEPENAQFVQKLYVDHDHSTGEIRGLLCMKCNAAIGHFNEDLTIVKKAVKYLENYAQKSCNNTTGEECSSLS